MGHILAPSSHCHAHDGRTNHTGLVHVRQPLTTVSRKPNVLQKGHVLRRISLLVDNHSGLSCHRYTNYRAIQTL